MEAHLKAVSQDSYIPPGRKTDTAATGYIHINPDEIANKNIVSSESKLPEPKIDDATAELLKSLEAQTKPDAQGNRSIKVSVTGAKNKTKYN